MAALGAAGVAAVLWPYTPKSRRIVPSGRVELTYWEKWTGLEGLALQRLVDRFNASQDRIWVHLIPIGDIDAKAMVAIGGGDPPDLVGLYTYNVPGYAEARAVIALDEFEGGGERGGRGEGGGGGSVGSWEGVYAPGVRELLWHEGRRWAGVNTCYTLSLYYNRALVERAPTTVDELDSLGESLTTRDGQGRITQAGFLQNLPGWWPYLWPSMFGGTLFDAGKNAATIDSGACVEAFEWIGATARRLGVAPTRAFAAAFGRSMHSAQDPFISGKLAMIVQGPWLGNFIAAMNPGLEYGVAALPVSGSMSARADEQNPVGLLEADVLMIPRGCPHPEEAYEFLCFHQQQREQEQLAIDHFKPSPMAAVSAEFLARHPHPGIRVHNAIVASRNATVLPRTRAWKQYSDLTIAAFDAVWGGADAKATLSQVNARAQGLIDAAVERRRQREGGRGAGFAHTTGVRTLESHEPTPTPPSGRGF
jgi:multiple sugar transport system substrate-binding protein